MPSRNPWKDIYAATQKEVWDDAIRTIDALIKKEPSEPQYFINLGDLYINEGNSHDALDAYWEAVRLYRQSNFANKAILLYKKILTIDPDNQDAQKELREITDRFTERKAVHIKIRLGKDMKRIEEPSTRVKLEDLLRSGRPPEFLRELLDRESLEALSAVDPVIYAPGEYIIREGETGDSLYLVLNGTVQISTLVHSQRIALDELHEGDVFGEMGFLTGKPRVASVIARTEAEVIELKRNFLGTLMLKNPGTIRYLYNMYASRMEATLKNLKKAGDSLSGSLSEVPLADILQFFEQTGKGGTLKIISRGIEGSISCRDNMVMDAVFGSLIGEDAFIEMLMATEGAFSFENREVAVGNMATPVRFALMEAMRLIDDRNILAEYIPRDESTIFLKNAPSAEDHDTKAVVKALEEGNASIKDIRSSLGISNFRVKVALAKLLKTGSVIAG